MSCPNLAIIERTLARVTNCFPIGQSEGRNSSSPINAGKGTKLTISRKEQDLLQRFDVAYERSQTQVMRAVERCVCGCDYGGNSWTTQREADELASILQLTPASLLLDLGSGSGWPGLYLSKTTGCRVSLVDPSETGMCFAAERAVQDGISDRVSTMVHDATDIDRMSVKFDAISHSDLLCCLPHKLAVLRACRKVIANGGRMAFTVISIPPGLGKVQYQRARESGPEFIECELEYAAMLEQSSWRMIDRRDITGRHAETCHRQISADQENREELIRLIGPTAFAERQAVWDKNLEAITQGLRRRELYVAEPLLD